VFSGSELSTSCRAARELAVAVSASRGEAAVDPATDTLKRILVSSVIRSVVDGDENNCVLALAAVLERLHQPSNQMVHVAEHSGEEFAGRQILALVVRCLDDGNVRQNRRVVREERPVAFLPHKVDQMVREDVRSELARRFETLAIAEDVRVPIAVLVSRVSLPAFREQAIVVETVLIDRVLLLRIEQVVDLPLARDTGVVAGRFHHAGNADFAIPVEIAAAVNRRIVMRVPAGAERVAAGQQHDACRAAGRCHIKVAELQAVASQSVDHRRLVFRAAVAAKPVLTNIVEQNKKHVRPLLCSLNIACRRQQRERGSHDEQ